MKEFRWMLIGSASGGWWAWLFAGNAVRGATVLMLTLIVLGLVELVGYLVRHAVLRWALPNKCKAR